MAVAAEPSDRLGEYTAGYYASLTPQSTSLFTITHNLGVIPKVVTIEADFELPSGRSTLVNAVYAFNVYGYENDGQIYAKYFFSGNVTKYSRAVTDISAVATETELTLQPVYSTARSPWNTEGQYKVRVLG